MKTISLTFDYELFFKRSGTFDNSLFRPTNELIKIFDIYAIKATFFIDVLYYQRLLEANVEEAKILREQLQLLVSKGHRIELHLHPHWLDAKYERPEWIFPNYDHYRLQSLPEDKVMDLFISGTEILNEISREVDNNYKVVAFRAGGWCITPFDKLKQGFLKSGIIIDSSIAPGIKIRESPFEFDFTHAPNREYYKYSNNPIIPDDNGIFYEIPITTYSKNFFEKVLKRFLKYCLIMCNANSRTYGDGTYMSINNHTIFKRIYSLFITSYEFLSIENNAPDFLIKEIEKIRNDLLVIMAHPKGLTQNSLECIKALYVQKHHLLTLFDMFKQATLTDDMPPNLTRHL